MISKYKGMRWLKCDLQMQTPADARHWLGERIGAGQEAEAAKAFAEACYKAGLDVVGITDHNFLSKDFLPYLQTAFDQIEQVFSHKITLFPGFEFEADVGKGMHVLCLFEPGTSVEEIDHILTECGVSRPRIKGGRLAKSTKRLPEILSIVQKTNADGTSRGIVIVPHVFEDSLFDNDRISEWLQQEEYRNSDLLAVEVPKPVGRMSNAFQKLFRSGDDCHQDWKRIRPIATLMSSDNKKLIDVDQHGMPTPNSIGYRYSWIKMSEPSIESLRQAFLDHDSRIFLPEDVSADMHPTERSRQAVIRSIAIKDAAFLADQDVYFSPNMNCIIGGRGSGKSTLLEYLRIMLGKGSGEDLDIGTQERINRIRDTLSGSGRNVTIKICWASADGVEDRIVWSNGQPTVPDLELADPDTYFNNLPVSFYSQQQLNRLTDARADERGVRQAERLLELVDGFAKDDLDELGTQEDALKRQIAQGFSVKRSIAEQDGVLKKLLQERQELERQWKARSEIQEDAHRHQLLKAEESYLGRLKGSTGQQFSDVAELAEEVASSHVSFSVDQAPHGEWLSEIDAKVKAAKDELAESIRRQVDQFDQTTSGLVSDDPQWSGIKIELEQADEEFNQACSDKGLTPDDVGHLQEVNHARSKKDEEIEKAQGEINRLSDSANDPETLMFDLHEIWRKQFEKRGEAVNKANDLAVLDESGHRFVEVSATYQQDSKSFGQLWRAFEPGDRRTRLGRGWDDLGDLLYDHFSRESNTSPSPWQFLKERLDSEAQSAGTAFGDLSNELFHHIQANGESWERLQVSRVEDTVDMKLFRPDGTVAGSIAEGSLSDGQRNTAALALLLAQDGGPLVIDQPEDELDSNFVFRELIPMLRKVKSKRQLIMATHNANLPVNGDAELVYAFEARDGRGEVLAQGGLDQSDVTKAVLDIMEGTEEAFRRRREKYHF